MEKRQFNVENNEDSESIHEVRKDLLLLEETLNAVKASVPQNGILTSIDSKVSGQNF